MKITQDEKVNLICFLLGIYDLRTYKNYQQGISAPPIFLYLESCSINELTKIKNTIQLNKNKQLSQTSNEDMKTNVIPLTSTISITTTDTTTASIPNLFKAIYLKKNTEYKKRKECEENKEYEEKLFFKQMEEVDNKFQKAHKRQFNKLYKKYIISDDEKEQNNILFQIFVLSRRLKNCLPSNSDDSSVSSILGKKYDDILPRISAVLEQNRRNATRPKVELNLSNSENYIYLLEDTKMNFLKILQKDIFELNMLDTKEVFENIWEKILFLWAKSISFRGEDANETEEIFEHLLDYEIILFNYKFAPPMMDCESIEDLYIHIKRECYKLLSKVL